MQFFKFLIFIFLIVLASSKSNGAGRKGKKTCSAQKPDEKPKPEPSADYCFKPEIGPILPFNNKSLDILPMSPKEMDVKFVLYTCKNMDKPQNFTYLSEAKEWENSNFNTSVITRFIVHGWNGKFTDTFLQQIKNLALDKSCVNVIVIDWSKPASSPIYYPSAINTRTVGKMIGCVINRWKDELNYSAENVHLIGHSLGGQVIGFAGKEVKDPKVRQITGLDPAGPSFSELNNDNKLASTDAQCVNIIHSNGARTLPILDGLGHLKPMGHIDFYPNGGHAQPGCPADDDYDDDEDENDNNKRTIGEISDDLSGCSHGRSHDFAIADQNYTDDRRCEIIGYRCKSYNEFKYGKCSADCGDDGSGCKIMPLDLDYWDDPKNCKGNDVHVQYFLNTGNVENTQKYCLYHYQIIININSFINPCFGVLSIKLSNGKQIGVKLGLKNILDLNIGNKKYSKLFTDSEELGDFTGAEIKPILGLTCSINKIEINYMTSLDASIRKQKSKTLCSTDGKTFSINC